MYSYHKIIVFSPILLAIAIVTLTSMIQNARQQEVLNIAVSMGASHGERLDQIEELRQSLGIENPYALVRMDGSYFFDNMNDVNVIQKFVVKVAAAAIDVFIAERVVYAHYHRADFFKPLEELFSPQELAQLTIINDDGIDMSAYTDVLEYYFGIQHSPVFLTVIGSVDLEQTSLGTYRRLDTIRAFVFHLTGITPDPAFHR